MGLSWLDRETSHILQCPAINLLACSQLFDPHLALSLQNPATAYLPLGIPNFLSFLGQRPFHLFLKQIAKLWRVQLYPWFSSGTFPQSMSPLNRNFPTLPKMFNIITLVF